MIGWGREFESGVAPVDSVKNQPHWPLLLFDVKQSMIISYPYLPDAANSESEQGPENRIFDFVQGHGAYPASHDMRWHGGVHLYAQGVTPVPVRAIADGEVVAYRRAAAPAVYQPNAAATAERVRQQFRLCSNTQTETGEGVKVVYYSLYMHLMNEADRKKTRQGAAADRCSRPFSRPV
jgi:hypothetical protein